MPTVVLFDIDGTLVSTGGAGRRAMELAFEEIAGSAAPLRTMSFGGMTDFAIVGTALRSLDQPADEDAIGAVLDRYIAHLPRELDKTTNYVIHSGVQELLAWLGPQSEMAIGLGTGNIERGARLKLGVGGLNDHFSFGGFGSDAEARAELIRRGAERGATALQVRLEDCRVVVIGDTVRDVTAAHAIGATCVAVGTGGVALHELEEAGARWVVEDLTDPSIRHEVFERR
ncbi:MAG: HAD family hydrolase [Myxococcota bacterium]